MVASSRRIPRFALAWRLALLAVACWGGVFLLAWGCMLGKYMDGCTDGTQCASGLCVNSVCLSQGCSGPSDCNDPAVGLHCTPFATPMTPGACVHCVLDDHCPDGRFCSYLFECVDCREDADCPVGEACWDGECLAPTQTPVNAGTTGDQLLPDLDALDAAFNGSPPNGWIAVWLGAAPEGGMGIFGRRLAGDLTPLGGDLRIDEASEPSRPALFGSGSGPRVAGTWTNGFFVVWEGSLAGQPGTTVFGRRFDEGGNPLGGEFELDSDVGWDERDPAVAADPFEGGVVVVWTESDGSGAGVFGRVFAPDGTPAGPSFPVNAATAGEQLSPDVAVATEGLFSVVWEGPDGDERGIFGRCFNASGGPLGSEFQIPDSSFGDQHEPAIATPALGNDLVVAWVRAPLPGTPGHVYARRFSFGGTPLTDSIQVDTATGAGPPRTPAVAVETASGNFAVAWERAPDPDLEGVYARRYFANGGAAELERRLNPSSPGSQRGPALALDSTMALYAVYQSDLADGSGTGLLAGHFLLPQRPALALESTRAPSGTGFTFGSGPRPTLQLETIGAGASGRHRFGLDVVAGDLELYAAEWGYPPTFDFAGFLALGPPGSTAGSYAFDENGDGVPEIAADLVTLDNRLAYVDLNGDRDPTAKPVLLQVEGPGLGFVLWAPWGGDGTASTLLVPASGRAVLELASGLITNPAQAGTYPVEARFGSVDPDNDDADDGAGDLPLSVYSRMLLTLGVSGELFVDGFESGDTSRWSSAVP